MNTRNRLSLSTAVLLVGAATAACGGASGAPTSASKADFCKAQSSLFENLGIDFTDPEAGMPNEKDMADAMHSWADELEKVGTPDDISDKARDGFEGIIKQASEVTEKDLKSPELNDLEKDMSKTDKDNAQAFSEYATEKCGSMMGNTEIPDMPEMPDSTDAPEAPESGDSTGLPESPDSTEGER